MSVKIPFVFLASVMVAMVIAVFSPFAFAETYLAPPCGNYGDLNSDGIITQEDADMAIGYTRGSGSDLTEEQKKRINVNGDDEITFLGDALLIARYANGSVTMFPACKNDFYANVHSVDLDTSTSANDNSINVSSGQSINGKFAYTIWNGPACGSQKNDYGCIDEIVLGINGEPKYCLDAGVPGGYPGKSGETPFSFNAPLSEGAYNIDYSAIQAYTCSDALAAYKNSQNKKSVGRIAVSNQAPSGLPDLTVESMEITAVNPEAGGTVNVTATVKNIGRADFHGSKYPYEIDYELHKIDSSGDLKWSSGSINSLKAGESKTLTLASAAYVGGGQTIFKVILDKKNAIKESDETNNEMSKRYIPAPLGLPDIKIEGVSYSPANPKAGEPIHVYIHYKNAGSAPISRAFDSEFSHIGADSPSLSFSKYSLQPGETGTATLMLIYSQPGTYSITGNFDTGNAIKELDETNNNISRTIVISEKHAPNAQTTWIRDNNLRYLEKEDARYFDGISPTPACLPALAEYNGVMFLTNGSANKNGGQHRLDLTTDRAIIMPMDMQVGKIQMLATGNKGNSNNGGIATISVDFVYADGTSDTVSGTLPWDWASASKEETSYYKRDPVLSANPCINNEFAVGLYTLSFINPKQPKKVDHISISDSWRSKYPYSNIIAVTADAQEAIINATAITPEIAPPSSICTTYKDPEGCTVTKCSGGSALKSCPAQPPEVEINPPVVKTKINEGWNLVSILGFIGGDDQQPIKTTCKPSDFSSMYLYVPQEKNYASLKFSGSDFSGITGETEADEQLIEKYEPSGGDASKKGYLIETPLNSIWIKSKTECEITSNYPENAVNDMLKVISWKHLEFAKGWNFYTVLSDMRGKTINDMRGECIIPKKGAYMYSSEAKTWVRADEMVFSKNDIGKAVLIRVASDCLFGVKDIAPPNLPESQISEEKRGMSIVPTGVPATYGNELGISFDDISAKDAQKTSAAINILGSYDTSITLAGGKLQRYIAIGSQISCEYCCSAASIIEKDGTAACGCAHAKAMRGIAKYLIEKHGSEYTDDEILEEVGKWKTLFFPGKLAAKAEVLKQKGIEINYINLASNKYRGIDKGTEAKGASMVGGC